MSDTRNDMLTVLGDLIGFPTVTTGPNTDLIDYAEDLLHDAGADTTRTYDDEHQRANLFATIGPRVDGGVVLAGHTDVVPAEEDTWTGAPFLAVRRGQRVYGRGAADMKGFLACALAMAPTFAAARLQRPVHLALTFDEEIGCRGAPLLLAELARTGPAPEAAIVGEPTGLRTIEAHKGCYEYTTTFHGVEGHGSAPGDAVNAVEYAVRFVSRLLEVGSELERSASGESRYAPPHTTLSVGTIQGGTARNIVAGECRVEWEMRPARRRDAETAMLAIASHAQALSAEMSARHPDASVSTETVGAVDGLEARPDSAAIDLMEELTGTREAGVVSFGTEAGLFQAAGIPTVVWGPGTIDVAHRPDEYVPIDHLEGCLDMMERLVGHLGGR